VCTWESIRIIGETGFERYNLFTGTEGEVRTTGKKKDLEINILRYKEKDLVEKKS